MTPETLFRLLGLDLPRRGGPRRPRPFLPEVFPPGPPRVFF